MAIWRPVLDKEKYKQAILFLLNSSANNTLLGKVKLFKLLYYLDFDHYQTFKTAITGDTYHKLRYGPVGDNADKLLREMASEGLITISTKPVGEVTQYVFIPQTQSKPHEIFECSEMEVLEQVAQKWANHTTGEIVTATHGEPPWRAVNMGEEIPYSLAFYRQPLQDVESNHDEEFMESFTTA